MVLLTVSHMWRQTHNTHEYTHTHTSCSYIGWKGKGPDFWLLQESKQKTKLNKTKDNLANATNRIFNGIALFLGGWGGRSVLFLDLWQEPLTRLCSIYNGTCRYYLALPVKCTVIAAPESIFWFIENSWICIECVHEYIHKYV